MSISTLSQALEIRTGTFLCDNKYFATRQIGRGAYGVVYEVRKLNNPDKKYALKAAGLDKKHLEIEIAILSKIGHRQSPHYTQLIEHGKQKNFSYIIMTLVGQSLSEVRKKLPQQNLSLFSTTVVSIQMFDAIHELHSIGYLHRDIKPANFAIGFMGTQHEHLVYILDFGVARLFQITPMESAALLRPPRKHAPSRGTADYFSPAVHLEDEQGRQCDLYSFIYTYIELCTGNLPWRGKPNHDVERMKREQEDTLLAACPKEIKLICKHIKELNYSAEPNYVLMRAALCRVWLNENFDYEMKLDWQEGGLHGDIFENCRMLDRINPTTEVAPSLEELLKISTINSPNLESLAQTYASKAGKMVSISETDDTLEDILGEGLKEREKQKLKAAKSKDTAKRLEEKSTGTTRSMSIMIDRPAKPQQTKKDGAIQMPHANKQEKTPLREIAVIMGKESGNGQANKSTMQILKVQKQGAGCKPPTGNQPQKASTQLLSEHNKQKHSKQQSYK